MTKNFHFCSNLDFWYNFQFQGIPIWYSKLDQKSKLAHKWKLDKNSKLTQKSKLEKNSKLVKIGIASMLEIGNSIFWAISSFFTYIKFSTKLLIFDQISIFFQFSFFCFRKFFFFVTKVTNLYFLPKSFRRKKDDIFEFLWWFIFIHDLCKRSKNVYPKHTSLNVILLFLRKDL